MEAAETPARNNNVFQDLDRIFQKFPSEKLSNRRTETLALI